MSDLPTEVKSLKDYFHVRRFEDVKGGGWAFSCLKCDASWSLATKGLGHPGNVLHLLNHAYGHKSPIPKPGSARA